MDWSTGLEELKGDRSQMAKSLKAGGKRVIGYLCCAIPVEMITALDYVPYRIIGNVAENITRADIYLETIMCPFVRSSFDLALKGSFDFLDGLVVPHTCDSIQRLYGIWSHYRKPSFTHFVDVPHMTRPSSFEFFENELRRLKQSLECFAEKEISTSTLGRSIRLHNESRGALRTLYELRKTKPPLISGTEIMQLLIIGGAVPVDVYNELLEHTVKMVKERRPPSGQKRARVLVYAGEVDSPAFFNLVEECGADVVMDEICLGTRSFRHDVRTTGDALQALSGHYLENIECPRTYKTRAGTHREDLDNRFGYLLDYTRDFDVDGVVLYITRYCDTFQLDAPDLRDYLREAGIPVLHLENDYNLAATGQLRTRVQAFLETIL